MNVCVACLEPIVAPPNRKVYWLRDRQGRELCMRCLADAVVDMAIGTQERKRHGLSTSFGVDQGDERD